MPPPGDRGGSWISSPTTSARAPQGTYCLDSTDYLLPVTAGERLARGPAHQPGRIGEEGRGDRVVFGPLGRRVGKKAKNSAPSLDFAVPACYNFRAALNGS